MIVNHRFDLNDDRIYRLHNCGVRSLRELKDVLDALDLRCTIELHEAEAPPPDGKKTS